MAAGTADVYAGVGHGDLLVEVVGVTDETARVVGDRTVRFGWLRVILQKKRFVFE
jgi:hypothetical protein